MAAVALITGASGLIGRRVLEQWDIEGLPAEAVDHRRDDLLEPGGPTALVERALPSSSTSPGRRAGHPTTGMQPTTSAGCRRRSSSPRHRDGRGAFVATGTSLDKTPAPADEYAGLEGAAVEGARAGGRRRRNDVGAPVLRDRSRAPAPGPDRPRALGAGRRHAVVLRTPDSEHDFIHAADVGPRDREAVRHDLRGEVPIGSGRLRRVQDLIAALGIPWVAEGEPQTGGVEHLSESPDSHRLMREAGRRRHGRACQPSRAEH